LAKEAGVRRFAYASTCSVYGAQSGDDLVDEDAPLKPATPYAISKVRVEDDLVKLADADFVPVSLRNATAFGFSPRLRADIVLNNLVGRAILTGRVTVLSDGTPWRPLAHAEDIAGAVVAALEAPADAVRAQAFNVGTEANNRTVAEIAQSVVEAVPGSVLEITGETGNDPRSYRVDFTRARRVLDFEARWTISEGAHQLAFEFHARGLTQEDFDQRFTRLAVLSARQKDGSLDADMRPVIPQARSSNLL
jgi:nucleoside-diphosphate-sugar epimerase